MIVQFGLVIAITLCAIMAVRSAHLLHAALWLAGVSLAVTIMLYLVGAYMLAVIELSLSVGLITILLVFAISMVGASSPDTIASKWLNWPLLTAVLLLILGVTLPLLPPRSTTTDASFSTTFWELREADVLAQIALIFAGVLGVLGLLSEPRTAQTRERSNGLAQLEAPPDDDAPLVVSAAVTANVVTESEYEQELEKI